MMNQLIKHLSKKERLVVAAILLLGIITRFINIDAHSLYIDESWVVPNTNIHYESDSIYPKLFEYPQFETLPSKLQNLVRYVYHLHPLFQVAAIWATDAHPPFFFMINYYWSSWFGYDVVAIRTPAAMYFVFTLVILFFCLKRQGIDSDVRTFGLLFLIFTPIYLFFSNFARPYSLLYLLCLVSFYLSYLVIQANYSKYRLVYVILATACMYTHYFGALAVASQGAYMMYEAIHKRQLRSVLAKIIMIYAAITVLFLPWFFVLILQMKTRFPQLEENSNFVYFDFLAIKELLLYFSPGYSKGSLGAFINWIPAILQMVLFSSGLVFLFKRWRSDYSRFWIFSFFGPFILIVLFNIMKPVFTIRNSAIIMIPYIIICAFGLHSVTLKSIRYAFAVFLIGVGAYFTLYGVSVGDAREGRTVESWKDVAASIRAMEDDPVVYIHHSSYRDGLYYYIKDLEKVKGLSDEDLVSGPDDETFILVVVNHRAEPIEEKLKRELPFLQENNMLHVELIDKKAETYIYRCEKQKEAME